MVEQPSGQTGSGQTVSTMTDANAANAFFNYLLAGALFLIAVGLVWYFRMKPTFDINDPDFNPLVFAAAAFSVIGVYQLAKAVRDMLRVRKFGVTTLEAGPAVVG
jgi:hypothetical protein